MKECMQNLSSDNPFYDSHTSCKKLNNELDTMIRSHSCAVRKKKIDKSYAFGRFSPFKQEEDNGISSIIRKKELLPSFKDNLNISCSLSYLGVMDKTPGKKNHIFRGYRNQDQLSLSKFLTQQSLQNDLSRETMVAGNSLAV